MRYVIMLDTILLRHASSKQVAELAFDRARKDGVERGSSLELKDTKTNTVLRFFHRRTIAQVVLETNQQLERFVKRGLERKEGLVKFANKLLESVEAPDQDPTQIMQWTDERFVDAARYRAALCIQIWMADNRTSSLQWIYDRVMNETLRGARSPKFSSSPSANYMELVMTAAWADAADELKMLIDGIAAEDKDATS